MEDITAEAGLSSGSTYLYFATKDELIRTAIEVSLGQFEAAVTEVDRNTGAGVRAFVAALFAALARFGTDEGPDLYRLAVQGWAFAQTDEQALVLIRASFARLVAILTTAVGSRLAHPDAVRAEEIARGIAATVVSFVVRRALLGDPGAEEQFAELDALAAAIAPA
jgi:AcrR family transcriptional regulator